MSKFVKGDVVQRTRETLYTMGSGETVTQGSLYEVTMLTGPSSIKLCNGMSYHEDGFRHATVKEQQWYNDAKKTGEPHLRFIDEVFNGQEPKPCVLGEDSGGSCDYYKVYVTNPTTADKPYTAECNDVIESLDMTYAEANMFKEIWRSAAARTLGKLKANHSIERGAEKIAFFAERNKIQKVINHES